MPENRRELNFVLHKGENTYRLSVSPRRLRLVVQNDDELSVTSKYLFGSKEKKRGILIGDHMVIQLLEYPYEHQDPLILSDGTNVNKGMKAAYIHFAYNLPVLEKDDNLITYAKLLIKSGERSIRLLAEKCKDDSRLEDVEVFFGVSHLARSVERFGFDVFDLEPGSHKGFFTQVSRGVADSFSGQNINYQASRLYAKDPKAAYISRNKLIELYGE